MAQTYINRDLTLTRPEFWAIATSKGLGFSQISEATKISWRDCYRQNRKIPLGSAATRHLLGIVAQLEGWVDHEGNII